MSGAKALERKQRWSHALVAPSALVSAVARHHDSHRASLPAITCIPLDRKPAPRSSRVALKAAARGATASRVGVLSAERVKEHAPLPLAGLVESVKGRL